MLYLLDANTLIDAEEFYYGFNQVPQFWEWLLLECSEGRIKMPSEIWDEIKGSNSDLGRWLNDKHVKDALLLDEVPDNNLVVRVLNDAYAPNLSDGELELVGRDPFLIAYALAANDRVVVTKEVSKLTATRGKRKIPDACNILGCTLDDGLHTLSDARL